VVAVQNTLFGSGNGHSRVLAAHNAVVERFGRGLLTNRTANRKESVAVSRWEILWRALSSYGGFPKIGRGQLGLTAIVVLI
jgi:hypothetical protein